MDRNPYAPPNAAIDDVIPTGLKRRSVLLMIVIFVVTLGLYFPIWFLRRRAALNRLDSPTELRMWPFLMYGSYFVLEFITAFMAEFAPNHTNARELAMFVTGLRMITGIVMIVQCFVVRTILEDHLAAPDDAVSYPSVVERVKLSGLMTFFFHIFYLQWAINRYIVGGRQEASNVATT